ncbi:Putative inositol monophosphatase [Septoria linicola]|uniref:Inositol monophosphatase n=1 Tax=Septoria linicola TaxID=215465 RepID=A0A9Q9B297_9PEZI|nr:putative inositol monophosphatase [Septoria linicola]USW56875.1 Putative inositol monophosphatase [Septoria linicola]
MPSQLQAELDVACAAVQHCAVLTKRLQRETLSQDSQIAKSDFSPVTVGDFASQALLTSAVHAVFPSDNFLAEESADDLRQNEALLDKVWELSEDCKSAFEANTPSLATPASKDKLLECLDWGGKRERSDEGRTWVFDPIDGTATFLKGQQYAINCAFLVDGREEIGIIGCPNVVLDSSTISEEVIDKDGLGLMIYAVRGEGTFVRPMQANGQLAAATKLERHGESVSLDQLIWSDCSTYTSTILELHKQIAAKLNTPWPGVNLFSSLMKYASLGLGRSHIVVRIFRFTSWRSNMWDHAGGVLIYEEAGGKVTDLEGKPIDFATGRKMAANYGLVCAPTSVHADILQLAQQVIKSHGPIPYSK